MNEKQMYTIKENQIQTVSGKIKTRYDISFNTNDSIFNSSFSNFKWSKSEAIKYAEQALGLTSFLKKVVDLRNRA